MLTFIVNAVTSMLKRLYPQQSDFRLGYEAAQTKLREGRPAYVVRSSYDYDISRTVLYLSGVDQGVEDWLATHPDRDTDAFQDFHTFYGYNR